MPSVTEYAPSDLRLSINDLLAAASLPAIRYIRRSRLLEISMSIEGDEVSLNSLFLSYVPVEKKS